MRVIIAGSRDLERIEYIEKAVEESGFDITHIISGAARGIDKNSIVYAVKTKTHYTVYPAEWDKYGKSAGYKRNMTMADNADALIAIWDGESRGTKHMIDIMNNQNKPVYIKIVKQ